MSRWQGMIWPLAGELVSPPGRRPREVRGLPEFQPYTDDGCEASPRCVDCPLPRCRYEEPGGLRALRNNVRDPEILQLRRAGVPVEELARSFGLSRRTVFRVAPL